MEVPDELRHRAARLAGGGGHKDDVREIFNWARQIDNKQYYTTAIVDIGDFAAHKFERRQGLTWDTGNFCCAIYRIGAWAELSNYTPNLADLKRALRAGPKMIPEAEIMQKARMTRRELAAQIDAALAKITSFDGSVERFSTPLTPLEKMAYDSFRRMRSPPLAIDGELLIRDLARGLQRQGILSPEQGASFLAAEGSVSVFAVSVMHGSKMKLTSIPGTAYLRAGADGEDSTKISVKIAYSCPAPGQRQTTGLYRVMKTNCVIRDWTSEELWSHNMGFMIGLGDWDQPLELGDDGKLRPIRKAEAPV